MKRGNSWLSKGVEVLALEDERGEPPCFDVVVVGSGYGGAVAAARLSAMCESRRNAKPMRVCVLERGVEYPPGSFPSSFSEMVGHQRVSGVATIAAQSSQEGLMDWRLGGDVWALVANGLGGGSLINAGVCEPMDDSVLQSDQWPDHWRGDTERWHALYERARHALRASPWPLGRVPKQKAMADLAGRIGAQQRPVSLSIVQPDAPVREGGGEAPPERPCAECGDCFTGCNVGAKLTLSHTYLAQAWRQGAEFYCGASVRRIVRANKSHAGGRYRWAVRYLLTDPLRLPASAREFCIHARHVIVAAGTFGSTEILMRSRTADLSFSSRLGHGFSANGDMLTAYYEFGQPVQACPPESQPLEARKAGPTITSQLVWPVQGGPGGPNRPFRQVLQELTVPASLGWLYSEVLTTMMVPQRWTQADVSWHWPGGPDIFAVDDKALQRTLLTVTYVDDRACGHLEPAPGWSSALREGALVVRWTNAGDGPPFAQADATLCKAAPLGSSYLRNPMWQFMPKRNYLGLGQKSRQLLTVHPLGGCRMADSARDGVVDAWGRVYDSGIDLSDKGGPGTEFLRTSFEGITDRVVHEGLYVLDGSIVPVSLGINPLLTITAIAEGAIDQWVRESGWTELPQAARALRPLPPLVLPPMPAEGAEPAVPKTAVRFGERMTGGLWRRAGSAQGEATDGEDDDDRTQSVTARQEGKGDEGTVALTLTFRFDLVGDLRAFLAQPVKSSRFEADLDVVTRGDHEVSARHVSVGKPSSPLTLGGEVRWFEIEPSSMQERFWRTAFTYLPQRFLADMAESKHRAIDPMQGLQEKLIGATHFGAVRRIVYQFDPLPQDLFVAATSKYREWRLPKGTVLQGTKRIGYLRTNPLDPESANPWRQLGEMTLIAETPSGLRMPVTLLKFDETAMLDRYDMPLAIVGQADAVTAMRDVASLAMYVGRALFGLHMFSFRRPEYPAEIHGVRGLRRLPPTTYPVDDPRFKDLAIEVHPVPVRLIGGKRIQLQLTRIRHVEADVSTATKKALPLMLIHGFGSGGVQFTHPAIKQPMATWLARQGHDVWVAELRTSIGLSSSRNQWVMDEVARQDIPLLIRAVCRLSGASQVNVVAHCIGSAMFSMAVLGGHLRRMVAKAVLMQVGPYVKLPRASRARGYIGHRMQQILGAAQAHSVASQDVSDGESVMDRLLATYLYPVAQRAAYRLGGDVKANARLVNANRAAGVFGQLFEHENMNPELLDVMDDLLGDCNLTTYGQTAQYVFQRRLTDLPGNDAYVTKENMRRHFNFPTLLLHGRQNRTFAFDTLEMNKQLFLSCERNVQAKAIEGHGHLDCVVGQRASDMVFKPIHAFLIGEKQEPEDDLPVQSEMRVPAVGPWIGHVLPGPDGDGLTLRVGLRVNDLGRNFQGVISLRVGANGDLGVKTWHPPEPGAIGVKAWPRHEGVIELHIPQSDCQQGQAMEVLVAAAHNHPPRTSVTMKSMVHAKMRDLEEDARRYGIPLPGISGISLDADWLARQVAVDPQDLGLVLGACRQRPLLSDREMADRAMGEVLAQLDPARNGMHAPIDALILCGDQIYADSRADSTHPAATGGTFLDAYREAWTATHQREVMRRRPTYMVIDDHEFRNNFNHDVAACRPTEFCHAHHAWWDYQLAAGPTRQRMAPGVLKGGSKGGRRQPGAAGASGASEARTPWTNFSVRGFHIFLCDTRGDRHDPSTLDRQEARIMGSEQMAALKDWLCQRQQDPAYKGRPKIVVMASPVAPLLADVCEDPAYAVRSDGWQRFPHSLAELFDFMADQGIDNVVFLSGDYHQFLDVDIEIASKGRVVRARSIATSGLYCPYPFANAEAAEWLPPHRCKNLPLAGIAGGSWSYAIRSMQSGSGFTRLSFDAQGTVRCDFVPTDDLLVHSKPRTFECEA